MSTFRLLVFRRSKLLRLVIGATSYLLKVFVRSMMLEAVKRESS